MLIKNAAIVAFILAVVSPAANAFTQIQEDYSRAVIAEVKPDHSSIVVVDQRTGDQHTLNLESATNLIIDGEKQTNFSSLAVGTPVTIKKRLAKKVNDSLEGEIVSVDHNKRLIKLKDSVSKETVLLRMSENTKVTGVSDINSFKKLRKGQTIIVRYVDELAKN